jgi:hypothetical protein
MHCIFGEINHFQFLIAYSIRHCFKIHKNKKNMRKQKRRDKSKHEPHRYPKTKLEDIFHHRWLD